MKFGISIIMLNFKKNIRSRVLKAIIVDDEEHVRLTLQKFLARYCPQVKVIGQAEGVAEAHEMISRHHPDLVLLDIKMGDGTGFDLLKKFETPDFKVIFITAHDQFAVQAFKVSAIDFILKPVDPEQLADAVTKAQQAVQHDLRIKLDALETNLHTDKNHQKKIVVKTLDNIYLLEAGHITHLESDGSYTKIFTTDQGEIMTSRPMKEYEEMLVGYGFLRIHRSFLINLAHVKRLEKGDGGFVVLTEGHKIPVASRKRDVIINLLDELAE